MRLTCLCVAIGCILAILVPSVYSQTMIEHAVTAAGGSAAGAAGKGVSGGIDKIFRKLDQQTKKAATNAEEVRRMEPQPVSISVQVFQPSLPAIWNFVRM